MRTDIVPGGPFPDYELSDHTGAQRRLSELQRSDPMILVLARGHFCPKDHQQHIDLAASYSKITPAYTQVVTISTDDVIETRAFRNSVGARWTFLSDTERVVQKELDIQEYTDPVLASMPLAAAPCACQCSRSETPKSAPRRVVLRATASPTREADRVF
jgi:peroxiredoxin